MQVTGATISFLLFFFSVQVSVVSRPHEGNIKKKKEGGDESYLINLHIKWNLDKIVLLFLKQKFQRCQVVLENRF